MKMGNSPINAILILLVPAFQTGRNKKSPHPGVRAADFSAAALVKNGCFGDSAELCRVDSGFGWIGCYFFYRFHQI